MKSDELPPMLMVYGVPAISIAIHRNVPGQAVGTKLGTAVTVQIAIR
jgi:hypothetical protein